MMKTTVVTGATGHIGANLVRALLSKGRPVRALLHVNQRAIDGLEVEIVKGDVCDLDSLYRAFDGADVVYHLAGRISLSLGDWPLLQAVNVIGTSNVVEACLQCGVRRLVHFSSIHALVQEPLDVPVNESRPLVESRRSPYYDHSKAAGEKEVRKGIERGLDAVIINPTGVIGPYDFEPSYFGTALLAMACRKLPALVAGGFDWVDARDVAAGAMLAEELAPNGARYLLSGNWVSVVDLAALVEGITGLGAPKFVCPLWLAHAGTPFTVAFARVTGGRPFFTSDSLRALKSNRNISHERASRDLGYKPRPFKETISDTLRWFQDNGYLDGSLKY